MTDLPYDFIETDEPSSDQSEEGAEVDTEEDPLEDLLIDMEPTHEIEYIDINESYCHSCEMRLPNAHFRHHVKGGPNEWEELDSGGRLHTLFAAIRARLPW